MKRSLGWNNYILAKLKIFVTFLLPFGVYFKRVRNINFLLISFFFFIKIKVGLIIFHILYFNLKVLLPNLYINHFSVLWFFSN